MIRRMEFHEKLKQQCDRRGWTQAALGRAMGGVSPNTVSNWFKGTSKPDLDNALKLSKTFGVPIEYWADDSLDDPAETGLTQDEKYILRYIRANNLDFEEIVRIARADVAQVGAPLVRGLDEPTRGGSESDKRGIK